MKTEKAIADIRRIINWAAKNKAELSMTKKDLAYVAKIDEQANQKMTEVLIEYAQQYEICERIKNEMVIRKKEEK